jgi:hypothetical protein
MTMHVTNKAVELLHELLVLPGRDIYPFGKHPCGYSDYQYRQMLGEVRTRGSLWFGVVKEKWPGARVVWRNHGTRGQLGVSPGATIMEASWETTELEAILAAAIVARKDEAEATTRPDDDDDEVAGELAYLRDELATARMEADRLRDASRQHEYLDTQLALDAKEYIAGLPDEIRVHATAGTHPVRSAIAVIDGLVKERTATIAAANQHLQRLDRYNAPLTCHSPNDVINRLQDVIAVRNRMKATIRDREAAISRLRNERDGAAKRSDDVWAALDATNATTRRLRQERNDSRAVNNQLRSRIAKDADLIELLRAARTKVVDARDAKARESQRHCDEANDQRRKYEALAVEKTDAMLASTQAMVEALDADSAEDALDKITYLTEHFERCTGEE